ncbi:MAG: hypothetical protein NC543_16350 [bacterium]|nr:hypothetical protein [bacterium]
MQRQKRQAERGSVEVEVTIILPIAILSVIMLLYLALFLFQRANLQAGLETALVYYKNTVTDTYVIRNGSLEYSEGDNSYMGTGNSYEAARPLNPYRGFINIIADNINEENVVGDFESYFRSVAGNMLFADNLEIKIDYNNYALLKEFEATAVQKVSWPIDLSIIGIRKDYEISASARVAVVDHDGIIRDVDYAIDLLEETKLGEVAHGFADKVKGAFEKMKEFLKFGA